MLARFSAAVRSCLRGRVVTPSYATRNRTLIRAAVAICFGVGGDEWIGEYLGEADIHRVVPGQVLTKSERGTAYHASAILKEEPWIKSTMRSDEGTRRRIASSYLA